MLNINELACSLSQLKGEMTVLSKLLTRNNNQHRKSKPHILMKTVAQHAAFITEQSEEILKMNKDAERLLRSHHKPSSSVVNESIYCLLGFHKTTVLCSQNIRWMEITALETGGYISQMMFLPLFTMYLALVARMHNIVASLTLHHAKRFDIFVSSLRSVSMLFPLHSDVITSALEAYSLPPNCCNILITLNPNDTDNAEESTRISSSHGPQVASPVHSSTERPIDENAINDIGEDIKFDRNTASNIRIPSITCMNKKLSSSEASIQPGKNIKYELLCNESPCFDATNSKKRKLSSKASINPADKKQNDGELLKIVESRIQLSITPTAEMKVAMHESIPTDSNLVKEKKRKKKMKPIGLGNDEIDDIFGALH